MKFLILINILLFALIGFANEETRSAVKEVQMQMKSPKFHQDAAKSSPEARKVEQQVKEIAGTPENEQEVYNLAAEVLGNMQDQTPEEMMKILQEAQGNPEAFANKWTPEQRKKLKELAERLPAAQKRNP